MRGLLLTVGLLAFAPAAQAQDKVLVLGGTIGEIIFDLGALDRVIARDSTTTYPPSVTDLPDVGYLRALSAEGVLSVAPDLIIAESEAGPPEVADVLKAAGIPWVSVPEANTADGVITRIRTVGEALDLPQETEALVAETQAGLDAAASAAARVAQDDRKTVLFVLSTQGGRIMAAGQGTSAEAIIGLAGAVNALPDIEGYKQVNDEAITAANPDVILMMENGGPAAISDDELFALPALANTTAAQNRAVLRLDGLMLLGFGPRTGEAALTLHNAIYGSAP